MQQFLVYLVTAGSLAQLFICLFQNCLELASEAYNLVEIILDLVLHDVQAFCWEQFMES